MAVGRDEGWPERAGERWSAEDDIEYVHALLQGATVRELAVRFKRTAHAIDCHAALMIPTLAGIKTQNAVEWVRARLMKDDAYPWRDVLETRRSPGGPRRVWFPLDTSRDRQPQPPPIMCGTADKTDRVLAIWQALVGASPENEQHFREHAALPALTCYTDDVLTSAGARLHGYTGTVVLQEWARECACGADLPEIPRWEDLAAGDPTAVLAIQELVGIAVRGLPPDARNVLIHRLGLEGTASPTLRGLGAQLGVSGETVRNRQNRAMSWLGRRHMPPAAHEYVGQCITHLLRDAVNQGVELASCMFQLSRAAMPRAPLDLGIGLLAVISGRYNQVNQLIEDASIHHAVQWAAILRQNTPEARATRQTAELLCKVEWPAAGARHAKPPVFTPQRTPKDRENSGLWPSRKLGRDVAFESTVELRQIRRLDRAAQITTFCEQPTTIEYDFDGIRHTYYPDLALITSDNMCILVEIKNPLDMALAVTQAKAAAAREYCATRGWGYLVTDGTLTLQDLLSMHVPDSAALELIETLRKRGQLTWRDITRIRSQFGINSLHVTALALQRGWRIHINPYRVIA